MSVIAFISGCLLYVALLGYFRRCGRTPLIGWISGKRIFERTQAILAADVPAWLGRFFPARRLQPQLLLIVLVALLAGVLAATTPSFDAPSPRLSGLHPALLRRAAVRGWLWQFLLIRVVAVAFKKPTKIY